MGRRELPAGHSHTEDEMSKDRRNDAAENQAEGMGKRVEGRVRNIAGSVTGDDSEQVKGKLKEVEGKVQQKLGKMQGDAARRRDRT